MAYSRELACLVLCSMHAAAAFAPHTPPAFAATHPGASSVLVCSADFAVSAVRVRSAAFAATRPGASSVRVRSAAFAESAAVQVVCALKQTLQSTTTTWLLSTQVALLLKEITKSAFGLPADLADLFLPQKLLFRLSVGLCSVFVVKMLKTDTRGAFVVGQAVLAVFTAFAGSDLSAIFTGYAVLERLCVFKMALIMPTVLPQAKSLAHRVGLYLHSLQMHFVAYRAFA